MEGLDEKVKKFPRKQSKARDGKQRKINDKKVPNPINRNL